VIRPDIAGLMGACGAAILARERWSGGRSSLLDQAQLQDFQVRTERDHCPGCTNQCQLTIAHFGAGRRFVSGNRCERGAGTGESAAERAPDLFAWKYRRLFQYKALPADRAPRGEIGIPRVLNLYENYPFWFTVLSELGFCVRLSGRSDHKLFEKGMDTIPSESVCYPAKLVHGHIVDLIERGIRTIFYPDISYEQKESPGANNHFNCPIVVSYPEVIRHNVMRLQEDGVRLLNPFLSLAHRRALPRRLAETFADFGVSRAEAKRALSLGFAEWACFQADVRAQGQAVLADLAKHGGQGIVLAGRPYHLDPEIHHGIPQLITGLGLAVLTEDSIASPGALQRPIRVVDQWAYHTRLYEAAAVVARHPELELVQLNSFGCGLDAVTGDQVQEILAAAGKIHTMLKIDETSNLGAARIRLRSLKVAMQERRGQRLPEKRQDYRLTRVPFTAAERSRHTILAPQMSPIHFSFIEAVLRRSGYRTIVLAQASAADVETGLKYVNNDACYPSIMVVGQLVRALQTGVSDPDCTSVFITQTGGGCRATNYVAFLRKALREAGFAQVPVVSISATGIEHNPGFALSLPLLHRAMQAIVLGDLLQTVLLRVRPYECDPGAGTALARRWKERGRAFFAGDRTWRWRGLVDALVADFDALSLRVGPRKPCVGIVGEILVKFHPDANNQIINVIEAEGCEAVMPGLLDFLLYCFYNSRWKNRNLGTSAWAAVLSDLAGYLMAQYRRYVVQRLAACGGKFRMPVPIRILADKAATVLSLGNDSGEGWFLTAEMMELIETGVPNIVCVQPFACLPNHVTGKGMIKVLRQRYPQANIVPVDYDPGASEVNQLNRIKLMLATAFRQHRSGESADHLFESVQPLGVGDTEGIIDGKNVLDAVLGDEVR
jgi:predicted nucleotide-binding protein (sugar kinase/HSP70/actin superfamily)